MTVQEMEKLLRAYRRQAATADVFRYSNWVAKVKEYPDIFGMNFEELFGIGEPRGMTEAFLAHERRGSLVRSLMQDGTADNSAMLQAFGFSYDDLRAWQREIDPVKKEPPARLVVLCFDDALRDQYEVAAPILRKYGFGATFFVAQKEETPREPSFEDKSYFMTWEQIADLEAQGFELGNHSKHHIFGAHLRGFEFNKREFSEMESDMLAHGLKKPVSCAYPSGICNRDTYAAAQDMGYHWGRGNNESGEWGMRGMSYYDPYFDSPLALPNYGDPDFYTQELLEERIYSAGPGRIFGLTYHSVSEKKWPGPLPFSRQMEILHQCGCTVISVAQLESYIDPVKAAAYTADYQ